MVEDSGTCRLSAGFCGQIEESKKESKVAYNVSIKVSHIKNRSVQVIIYARKELRLRDVVQIDHG